MHAAQSGATDVVKFLLEHTDIDVNKIKYNQTALDIAEDYEHPKCAKLIREAGGKKASEL